MKKFFKDFKAFIARGNVMDMAIGVIIGGAFGKIVTSLVNDIIMPLIALAMGGQTLAGQCIVLNGVDKYIVENGVEKLNPAAVTWNYGNFIQTVIDFLIIAICVFVMLKIVMSIKQGGEKIKKQKNKKKQAEEPAPEPAPAPVPQKTDNEKIIELLGQINDKLSDNAKEQGDK